jgi:Flp pilus assembly CpaE family ATPase
VSDIDDSLLKSVVVPHDSGLHILVGSKNILDDTEMIPLNVLENVLQRLKEKYAYIVVDLPTHILDPYHQYLVDQSDMVLLVSCLDIPGLYRTRQYMDLARQHIDLNKVKLILNRWNLKAAYGMSNKNLEEEFRYPVYFRLPNDWDLNVEANSLGNVFSRLNPNADLSKSIQKLAAMVAARDPSAVGEAEQGKNNTKSLLTGFFKKK